MTSLNLAWLVRLRRFEFGIAQVTPEGVEVYARQPSGRTFYRTYPRALAEGVLERAEAEFPRTMPEWRVEEAVPPKSDLRLVWDQGARLHVSGEAALTEAALAEAAVDLVVSLQRPGPEARRALAHHVAHRAGARHLERPVQDVLPPHHTLADESNALEALNAIVEALRAGRCVLVHCLMGIHRAPSMAAVALRRAGLAGSSREAFLAIHARRPVAGWHPETVAWLEGLRQPEAPVACDTAPGEGASGAQPSQR